MGEQIFAKIVSRGCITSLKNNGYNSLIHLASFSRYFDRHADVLSLSTLDSILKYAYDLTKDPQLLIFKMKNDEDTYNAVYRNHRSSCDDIEIIDILDITSITDINNKINEDYIYITSSFIENVLLSQDILSINCKKFICGGDLYNFYDSTNGVELIKNLKRLGYPIKFTDDMYKYVNSMYMYRFSNIMELFDGIEGIPLDVIKLYLNPKDFSSKTMYEHSTTGLVNLLGKNNLLEKYLDKSFKVKTITFRNNLSLIIIDNWDLIEKYLGVEKFNIIKDKYVDYILSCKKYTEIHRLILKDFSLFDGKDYDKEKAKNIVRLTAGKTNSEKIINILGGEEIVPEHIKMYIKYMTHNKDDVSGPFAYIQTENIETLKKYSRRFATAFLNNYSNNRGDCIHYIKGIWNSDNMCVFMKDLFKEMESTRTTTQIRAMFKRLKGSCLQSYLSKVELFSDCLNITKVYLETTL